MIYRYYYQRMNKAEREVYDAMLSGFSELAAGIRILRPDTEGFTQRGSTFGDIFFRLRLDNPEIFYVTGCNYRYAQNADYAELMPEYMFDRQQVKEHRRALEARITKLLRPAESMDEAGREKYIHDFICQNVRYDKLKKPYSHEIIGPLQNGVGVCEGIAKTVKLMCDRLGIECVVVIGDKNPDSASGYLHAWNVVKIGGKRYHLDATFDNSLGRESGIRYDYFNLPDKQIFRDHRPLIYPGPECTESGGFYYKSAGMSFTKPEELANRVGQALRKKRESMVFHWRGGYLTRQTLSELIELIDTAAAGRGKKVSYSVNFAQAVIRLDFGDSGGGDVTEENADEGENL